MDQSLSSASNGNTDGGTGNIREHPPTHYYGDTVRRLFIASGVIILLGSPFFYEMLARFILLSAIGAVVIAVVAGVSSPRSRMTQILFLIVSAIGVTLFESYAAYAYLYFSFGMKEILFFLSSQTLAVLFFLALYYSTKTVRWMSRPSG